MLRAYITFCMYAESNIDASLLGINGQEGRALPLGP